MIVADDGGQGRGSGGRGGGKETARLSIRVVRLLRLLLGVVNDASMWETAGRWLAVAIAVAADRQQCLAVSVCGGNAVAPQAVLALLKGRRTTSNDGPASLLAARDTAYIHINPRLSSVDIFIIFARGTTPARGSSLSRRCVLVGFLFFFLFLLNRGD